jgi:hypothetical protein
MKLSLTFSPADGSIKIQGCPVDIASHLSKTQACASLASLMPTSVNHGNGYEWLTLHGMSPGGRPCSMALGFCGETLERVHWGVVWSAFDPKGFAASSGLRFVE